MSRLKIVFMGTPDFAVPCLNKLLNWETVEIIGVVTQPDKPRGRGQKLSPSPVKAVATEHGLKVYQPLKVKDAAFLAEMEKLRPDLIVVVAFGQILPPRLLAIPTHGSINVHASLLPRYRGAAPIEWCLINGDTETGVTTMMMDVGLDTGDMLGWRHIAITDDMDVVELQSALQSMGADLLIETIAALKAGTLKRVPQDDDKSCYAPMLTKETGHITWEKSAEEIHNLVRGLNSWPVAHTFLNGQKFKIYKTRLAASSAKAMPGEIITADKSGLIVGTGKGALAILELQAPSGKRLKAVDYINGHGLKLPARFEG